MKTYVGKSVYHGIAIGQIQILKKEKKSVYRSRIVDGFKGELIVEPTDELLAEYEDKAAQEVEKKHLLQL